MPTDRQTAMQTDKPWWNIS